MSYFNHEKYPIIVGATYVSKKSNDEGVLDAAELRRHKNEAEIIIKTAPKPQNPKPFKKLELFD